ncbi:hypothetical protein C8247_05990 [Paracidovorax avenae]|uniref:hypothetical protein n=1 Tax=Paracidovorax avenae TaxID=80867 RepID=UPI000D162262|nr:hypothetical protein [Paracidovorax avenae]AVS70040.1 hypothetical protein C8247_05990 [Paracidovorax avenae]
MNAALDLIGERGCGFVRVSAVGRHGAALAQLLESFGLQPDAGALSEVTREVSAACVSALLWRDMAYGVELMPRERADAHAHRFLEECAVEGATFFTNGRWDLYHDGGGGTSAWSPLTSATFSAAVLVVCPAVATCLLVEDED